MNRRGFLGTLAAALAAPAFLARLCRPATPPAAFGAFDWGSAHPGEFRMVQMGRRTPPGEWYYIDEQALGKFNLYDHPVFGGDPEIRRRPGMVRL